MSKAIGLDICTLFAHLCIKVISNQWFVLDFSQDLDSSPYLSATFESLVVRLGFFYFGARYIEYEDLPPYSEEFKGEAVKQFAEKVQSVAGVGIYTVARAVMAHLISAD
ncbi:hypothetical protein [Vibrio natriegens]|uniref:hypothetical protein n=1 Tax=Vibrio natriegens TaxID=691 RepID=UPI0012DB76E6|nr:hypothetical protein [Vibrio natriegens]